ncbi:hypothetical protein MRX96_037698 [Rhipicephalus microplus]
MVALRNEWTNVHRSSCAGIAATSGLSANSANTRRVVEKLDRPESQRSLLAFPSIFVNSATAIPVGVKIIHGETPARYSIISKFEVKLVIYSNGVNELQGQNALQRHVTLREGSREGARSLVGQHRLPRLVDKRHG